VLCVPRCRAFVPPRLRAFTPVLLLGLATGCSGALAGNWRMVETIPNRETFNIDNATFTAEGDYSALTTIEGLTVIEKGTFEFTGFKLKLRPRAGGQRTYDALLRMNRLEIMDGKRKVVLQKVRA
jgi:hypothetical protein